MALTRVFSLLIALIAALLPVGGVHARAAAQPDPSVISALRSERFYAAPGQTTLDAAGVARVKQAVKDSPTPVYLVVTGDMGSAQTSNQYLAEIANAMGSTGVYGLLSGRHFAAGSLGQTGLSRGEAGRLASEAASEHRGQPADGLVSFVDSVNVASGQRPSTASSALTYGFLGVLLILVVGGFFYVRASRRRRARDEQRQLQELKQGVEEDVTRLGEDIAALDLDLKNPKVDPAAKDDYVRALDSYDRAKAATQSARTSEDMEQVTHALEDGRYYMVAVRARQAGEPVPERRPPCFFNPQHGPSVRDVLWAPMGGQAREVPACAADAERVEHGADPEARMVEVAGQRRPYWEAGPQWAPYAGGYYAGYGGFGMLNSILIGTAIGSMWGGGFGGMGYGTVDHGGGFGDFGGGGGFGDFGGGGGFGDFGGGDF
ncbi:hypothetical protein [Actinocorallia libanotica]|uniref:Membrane protein YgcG n=1 Tax=Actinocorallia libanotica TaxID=46162 RepID=A0ABP4C261_9ACTN